MVLQVPPYGVFIGGSVVRAFTLLENPSASSAGISGSPAFRPLACTPRLSGAVKINFHLQKGSICDLWSATSILRWFQLPWLSP